MLDEKAARKKPTSDAEADVLLQSRRRCALCFGLRGDLQEKRGQIAHVDRDPSNSVADNLCFLCHDHHSEYDSKSRQSKGLTPEELRRHREKLYSYIEQSGLAAVVARANQPAETIFLTLESPSVENGKLDLVLRNEGTAFNIKQLQVTTPGCWLHPWYPPSVPAGAILRIPTQLPQSGMVECNYQIALRDRSGAERLFQVSVDPRPSPAKYDFVELF